MNLKGATVWLCPGSALEKKVFGTGWAVSFLLCTIGLTKQSFHLGPSFLALNVIHSLSRQLLAESADS